MIDWQLTIAARLPKPAERAQVAELVDALASGASTRKGVEVRVFSWAPFANFKNSVYWSKLSIFQAYLVKK